MLQARLFISILLLLCAMVPLPGCGGGAKEEVGSAARPLRVMLIPAYGGTQEGTLSDFRPLFRAITDAQGIHFDIRIGSSYGAVVEAMANEQVDIAWFGVVSYTQAKERGAAELLAVPVDHGNAVYYSAILHRADSGMKTLTDLRGKRMAFGDPSSSSGFNFPVAMMLDAGVNPATDLGTVIMAGNHASSIAALVNGEVDAACTPMLNYDRAVEQKIIDPKVIVPLKLSDGIPNPPLAMHPKLPAALKQKLREAFNTLHQQPNINPQMIKGEGGKVYERYDGFFSEQPFIDAMKRLNLVTDGLRQQMLVKAQQR
ncbi:MAG: phosphate/phosphite/phosphonate ABC transporter substrate-binding protein [Phycisphaeraceae bacterium]